jgi:hypothetical protein
MPSSTEGLAGFLLARIDEDAALLRPFNKDLAGHLPSDDGDLGYYLVTHAQNQPEMIAVRPLRLLLECQTKRDIVRAYQHTERLARHAPEVRHLGLAAFTTTLQALARAYATHPDFRDEWSGVVPI